MGDEHEVALLKQALDTERLARQRLESRFDAFKEKQMGVNEKTATSLAVLVAKSGAWGAISGAVVIIAALLMRLL